MPDTPPSPRSFKLPPPPPPGCDVRELMRYNDEVERLRLEAARAAKSSPPPPVQAVPSDPNDVHAMLAENKRREADLHLNTEVDITPRSSRRTRDFLILVIALDLLLVGSMAWGGFNAVSVVFGLAGIIIVTIGAAWIMFGVMDRY